MRISVLVVSLMACLSINNVSAQGQNQDAALRARLNNAQFVVTGEVIEVVRLQNSTTIGSEHDPDWHYAKVRVADILKGVRGQITLDRDRTINVHFTASMDVIWFRSHKFKVGEKGIFILKLESIAGGDETLVLTALHQLDFQSLEQLNKIKSLLVN